MPVVNQQLPCPHCDYRAFNQMGLESHLDSLHDYRPSSPPVEPVVVQEEAPAPVLPLEETVQVAEPAEVPVPVPHHPALTVPDPDPLFWTPSKVDRLLFHLGRLAMKGERLNVLLTGPKGTGKTSLPQEFAAAHRFPFFTAHCQLITERDDWWGTKELSVERGTFFEKAAFLDAVETPGCVICLDEANRTHPENLNALFGLLDHRRSAFVPLIKREVRVAEGVVFFVTLNEGFEYMGTVGLDEALRDRMTYSIRMQYPPKRHEQAILQARTGVAEDVAEKLCEFAQRVRRNPQQSIPVSTRQLLGAAQLVSEGMSLPEAVQFGVVNGLGDGVDRQSLLQALQIIGNVNDAYVEGQSEDDDDD